jgi:hypothetical protein
MNWSTQAEEKQSFKSIPPFHSEAVSKRDLFGENQHDSTLASFIICDDSDDYIHFGLPALIGSNFSSSESFLTLSVGKKDVVRHGDAAVHAALLCAEDTFLDGLNSERMQQFSAWVHAELLRKRIGTKDENQIDLNKNVAYRKSAQKWILQRRESLNKASTGHLEKYTSKRVARQFYNRWLQTSATDRKFEWHRRLMGDDEKESETSQRKIEETVGELKIRGLTDHFEANLIALAKAYPVQPHPQPNISIEMKSACQSASKHKKGKQTYCDFPKQPLVDSNREHHFQADEDSTRNINVQVKSYSKRLDFPSVEGFNEMYNTKYIDFGWCKETYELCKKRATIKKSIQTFTAAMPSRHHLGSAVFWHDVKPTVISLPILSRAKQINAQSKVSDVKCLGLVLTPEANVKLSKIGLTPPAVGVSRWVKFLVDVIEAKSKMSIFGMLQKNKLDCFVGVLIAKDFCIAMQCLSCDIAGNTEGCQSVALLAKMRELRNRDSKLAVVSDAKMDKLLTLFNNQI